MLKRPFDRCKLPGRRATEGPARAPHRSFHDAKGHDGMKSLPAFRKAIAGSGEPTMRSRNHACTDL